MKKIIVIFMMLLVMFVNACSNADDNSSMPTSVEVYRYDFYVSFVGALRSATDVVVVQYIDHKPYGRNLTEYEFVVLDRVLGDAPSNIFVYARNDIHVRVRGDHSHGCDIDFIYYPGDLTFNTETYYLLLLRRIDTPYSLIHGEGFTFLQNIVIDLDNPSNSTMYNEPLSEHSDTLVLNQETSRQEIISVVEERTREN